MEHKIETDVRNAYDNMPLEELSEYMENVDIPTVSDESKARIKKLVNEKIGINNSNGDFYRGKKTKNERNKVKKSVYRFATMAAACVLVLGGVLFMNTDSVKASLAKLFGFVPGMGVVEVPSDEKEELPVSDRWFILKQARYSGADDMIGVEIQNATLTNNELTINYTVDLLNISVNDLEVLSDNLSDNSFKDYADLYRSHGYETYFGIKETADTLTPLSSVELNGSTLNLLNREVLSGEALEGAKLICISESYKVENINVETMPAGSLTVGALKVDFGMRDLQAYILDESAEQNGAICTADGMKLLCVPTWEGETLLLDFYTLESGEYERLLGFGMGVWPVVTVNNQEIEGYADERYVFESENTGCLGRRLYYDLSDVEGEIKTLEVTLEGVMAVNDEDVVMVDVTAVNAENADTIEFSQQAYLSGTNIEFVGLEKYQDEDEFLYSEYGNVLVSYRTVEKDINAVFAGFDEIYINGIKQDIWAEGMQEYQEIYLKLPCEFQELEKIECKGAQYFVYRNFTFTIEK